MKSAIITAFVAADNARGLGWEFGKTPGGR
jgi:hypothetical protein